MELKPGAPVRLSGYARNVTSQNGENGIIDKIFEAIGVTNRVLVDCGASDLYLLSNVCPLWRDRGWRAVLIEGNPVSYERMQKIKTPSRVRVVNAYVEADGKSTLDNLLASLGLPGDFDLLNLDVDGIDYHLWKSLRRFTPRLVVIEYNPTIPPHLRVVGRARNNFVGASAKALTELAAEKGYRLAAVTKTNLFFVRSEYAGCFADAGRLEALFDYSCVNYVMTSYDGGLFYSNTFFPYGYTPFSNQVKNKVENEDHFYIPSASLLFYVRLKFDYWQRRLRREFLKPCLPVLVKVKNLLDARRHTANGPGAKL